MNAIAGTDNIIVGLSTTYGGNIGGTPGTATVGNPNLSNDHPVSIAYNAGTAGLRTTDTVLTTVTTTSWVGATTIANLLRNSKVECGSCHDPHNGGNTQGVSTEVNFLRHSNQASKLCLGCHNK
jgi:predicted CXXCH cytochrome family protein